MAREAFTFGIPLIAKSAAGDWERVEALLDLAIASLRAQSDAAFEIVIAGHDRPRLPADRRIRFIAADWPAMAVRADNLDSGRKKHLLARAVAERGGGLLMFVDADDWLDLELVERARAEITPDAIGGIIETGFVTDLQTLRTAPIPHARVFAGGFHRICGSSTIARLRPGHPDALRRDPTVMLHEHHRWIELAAEHGARVTRLSAAGNYVINTSQNHSETQGPFAAWRRDLVRAVQREGFAATDDFLGRFGLSRAQVGAARLVPAV